MDQRLVGDRYRLTGPRAMGGMASIWRAIDERTGDVVAVKLLHPLLAASDAARARLDREAAALGAISHPNVVGVREVVIDDGGPAVVMDYVEGVSLAERLAGGRSMSEGQAIGIALDVSEALRAVHAAGLIHRDVKPGNIILGADGRTRLIGFGIATDIDAPLDATALTAADDVIGTLRYLAPERVDGEPASPSTDVWGVGAVLFEMLAGRPAYPSATIMERASSSVDLPARPVGIADPVWAVIEQAMAIDPAERPAGAAELAAALRPLAADRVEGAGQLAEPSADTIVITVPVAGAAAASGSAAPPPHPAGPTGWSSPSAVAGTGPEGVVASSRSPNADRRPGLFAGLAAAAIAAVVIVASAGSGPDVAGLAAPTTTSPPGGSALPAATTRPVDADEAVDDVVRGDDGGPGKGNDHGKGTGRGKGHDKDD